MIKRILVGNPEEILEELMEAKKYYDVECDRYTVEPPSYYYGYTSPEREKLAFEDYLKSKEE